MIVELTAPLAWSRPFIPGEVIRETFIRARILFGLVSETHGICDA